MPRSDIGCDGIASSGVAIHRHSGGIRGITAQPHRIGIGDGSVLVEFVGGVGLHECFSTDGFGSGSSIAYRFVIIAEFASAVNP